MAVGVCSVRIFDFNIFQNISRLSQNINILCGLPNYNHKPTNMAFCLADKFHVLSWLGCGNICAKFAGEETIAIGQGPDNSLVFSWLKMNVSWPGWHSGVIS